MTVFETEDYRAFIRAWIRSLPKNGRGEVNRIAERLNINPTVISQTLSGVRDLSPEHTLELIEHMGLSSLEGEYFSALVQIERAGTAKLKAHLKNQLAKLRTESLQVAKRIHEHRVLSETDRATFYSSFLYIAVRLFTDANGGQTLEDISQRFDLTRARTQEILSFLISTRLCVEKDGVYSIGPQATHLEATSPFISKHHTNWRVKSMQRAEDIDQKEMMFTAPMVISKNDFDRFREKMVLFVKDIIAEAKESKSEDVACFNLDFFWVKR